MMDACRQFTRAKAAASLSLMLMCCMAIAGQAAIDRASEAASYRSGNRTFPYRWFEVVQTLEVIEYPAFDALQETLRSASMPTLTPADRRILHHALTTFMQQVLLEDAISRDGWRRNPAILAELQKIESDLSVEMFVRDVLPVHLQSRIDEATLRSVYEQSLDSFRQPERRSARYIFLSSQQTQRDPALSARIIREITLGETTFEAAARLHSQHPSRRDGGIISSFARGTYNDSAFEEAVFSRMPGQPPAAFRVDGGEYIVETLTVEPASDLTFEAALPRLRPMALELHGQQLYDGYLFEQAQHYDIAGFDAVEGALASAREDTPLVLRDGLVLLTVGNLLGSVARTPTFDDYRNSIESCILRHQATLSGINRTVDFVRTNHLRQRLHLHQKMLASWLPPAQEPTRAQAETYYRRHEQDFSRPGPLDAVIYQFDLPADSPAGSLEESQDLQAFLLKLDELHAILVSEPGITPARVAERATALALPRPNSLVINAGTPEQGAVGDWLRQAQPGMVSLPIIEAPYAALATLVRQHPAQLRPFAEVEADIFVRLRHEFRQQAEAQMWARRFEENQVRLSVLPPAP